jgi:hypothetical protein
MRLRMIRARLWQPDDSTGRDSRMAISLTPRCPRRSQCPYWFSLWALDCVRYGPVHIAAKPDLRFQPRFGIEAPPCFPRLYIIGNYAKSLTVPLACARPQGNALLCRENPPCPL